LEGKAEGHVASENRSPQYSRHKAALAGGLPKNDHLGFQIHYLWGGSRRRFLLDFIIRLAHGKLLALEIKGEDSTQNKAKRAALAEWIEAINLAGGFGVWCWDVAFDPAQIHDIVATHSGS